MEQSSKMKVIWLITERGERKYWSRVGIGSVNRDGSINLTLDALPVGGGRLQVRDYSPRDADPQDAPSPPRERSERSAEPPL